MTTNYRGWIPTVTGHLSFSVLGTGKNPSKRYHCYKIIGDRRYTVAVERRRTSDVPFRLLDKWKGKPSWFYFVLLCASSTEDNHEKNSGAVWAIDETFFYRIEYQLKQLESDSDPIGFERRLVHSAIGLDDMVQSESAAKCDVTFFRNGQASIGISESPLRQEEAGVLENQVFYFLKDVSHRHQHHEDTSETILKAYKYDCDDKEGQERWKRETLYALYRWVIQQKRTKSVEAYYNCAGVIAYARSFTKLHVSEGVLANKKTSIPDYDYECTLDSLESGGKLVAMNISNGYVSKFFTQVVPIFGILLSIVGVLSKDFLNPEQIQMEGIQVQTVRWLLDIAAVNPIAFLSISFVPILAKLISSWFKSTLFHQFRPVQRIALALGYYHSLAILACLILLLLVLLIYLVDLTPPVY